ncbi:MAG: tryptophan synthase subunit alpha [Saprospiraceae bacterium]
MNRIIELFQQKDKDILNIYFTAGYPKKEDTTKVILALDEAGVDLIEIGMPYSDPLADGPTIQESGTQAIENGMTMDLLFDQIAEVRKQTQVPLVLMGYFNQVMQYGEQRFFEKAKAVGIDGLILPDLPVFEYESIYRKMIEAQGLSISFLITPQTSENRIRQIDELTKGFIYMVSNSSITGAKSGISEEQLAYFHRINAMQLQNPRLIGFGISDHATYRTACDYSNGAIIGSAFIRTLAKSSDVRQATLDFVRMVKDNQTVGV